MEKYHVATFKFFMNIYFWPYNFTYIHMKNKLPWRLQLRPDNVCPRVTPDRNEILLDPYKET
jgi:hypothetical protein